MHENNNCHHPFHLATVSPTLPRDRDTVYALHEAGHAIVILNQGVPELASAFEYVTIDSHSFDYPHVHCKEQDLVFKDHFKSELAIRLGGRAAEQVIYGLEFISSASTIDIKRANRLAIDMTCNLGFSHIGPVDVEQLQETEYVDAILHDAFHALVIEAQRTAQNIIFRNKSDLLTLSATLKERKTMHRDEVLLLLDQSEKQLTLDL